MSFKYETDVNHRYIIYITRKDIFIEITLKNQKKNVII